VRSRRWFVLAVVMGAVGCVPQAVYRQHAELHGCDPGQVKAWEVESHDTKSYRASGCGHDDIYYCHNEACRTPRKVVLDRHAAEFGCARSDVEVRNLGGGAWLADGCGRRRTYNCLWSTGDLHCIAETERSE
jgi:hypothetical protein